MAGKKSFACGHQDEMRDELHVCLFIGAIQSSVIANGQVLGNTRKNGPN